MSCSSNPPAQVEGVTVNRSGSWAVVWGSQGVTAVQLPRRGGRREEVVVTSLALVKAEVQSVAWHPGSAQDSHITVLTRCVLLPPPTLAATPTVTPDFLLFVLTAATREGRVVLYNVSDGVGEVRGVSLGEGGRIASALGEVGTSSPASFSPTSTQVAVDLCFGPAGEQGQWPLFVLFGNCDVFCVSAGIGQEWRVEGPLEVRLLLLVLLLILPGEACERGQLLW